MRTFLKKNQFFSDLKRVYYIIITVGKVSSHENFGNMYEQSSAVVLPSWSYKVAVLKNFAKLTEKHQR